MYLIFFEGRFDVREILTCRERDPQFGWWIFDLLLHILPNSLRNFLMSWNVCVTIIAGIFSGLLAFFSWVVSFSWLDDAEDSSRRMLKRFCVEMRSCVIFTSTILYCFFRFLLGLLNPSRLCSIWLYWGFWLCLLACSSSSIGYSGSVPMYSESKLHFSRIVYSSMSALIFVAVAVGGSITARFFFHFALILTVAFHSIEYD